jgi:hypothetical protein
MRRALVCSLLVLALAGCGGTGSRSTATVPAATPSTGGDSSASTPSTEPSAGGGADCSSISKEDVADFIVGTQLLAQVRDKAGLEGITSGTIGRYTPEAYGAILAKMSFLTGAAADGLATLVAANEAVKKLASGSPTQADFDAYQQQTGGVTGLIKAQVAVNIGLAQACPSLG